MAFYKHLFLNIILLCIYTPIKCSQQKLKKRTPQPTKAVCQWRKPEIKVLDRNGGRLGYIWPYENAYYKFTLYNRIECGKMDIFIYDIPLRTHEYIDEKFVLSGLGNAAIELSVEKQGLTHTSNDNQFRRITDNSASFTLLETLSAGKDFRAKDALADIPKNIFRIKPSALTAISGKTGAIAGAASRYYRLKFIMDAKKAAYFTQLNFKLMGNPGKKYAKFLYQRFAYNEFYKKVWEKPVRSLRFTPQWRRKKKRKAGSTSTPKSKTLRFRINKEFVKNVNMGPGIAGAINVRANEIYGVLPSTEWNYYKSNVVDPLLKQECSTYTRIGDDDVEAAQEKEAQCLNLEVNYLTFIIKPTWKAKRGRCYCDFSGVTPKANVGDLSEYIISDNINVMGIDSRARLLKINLSYKNNWVHLLNNDGNGVNLLKRGKYVKMRFRAKPMCGVGGPCRGLLSFGFGSIGRSKLGKDGWDIFEGETIKIEMDFMGQLSNFDIPVGYNPYKAFGIVTGFKKNIVTFYPGRRKLTFKFKPEKKIQHGIKYPMEIKLTTKSVWHKAWLNYQILFINEQEKQGHKPLQGGCNRDDEYKPARPVLGCPWPPLKSQYFVRWQLQTPEPGYIEHVGGTRIRMSSVGVGERKCAYLRGRLEFWPSGETVKVVISYRGTNGGLSFRDKDLRLEFPERIINLPGAIQIKKPGFPKLRKWCVKGLLPGSYIVKFSVYGSLARLFPNPPDQIQVNVNPQAPFKLYVPSEIKGATLFNNEWSDAYPFRISRLPNKKDNEDIVIVLTSDIVQISPDKMTWKHNHFGKDFTQRRIKLRPLLDCAVGGVKVTINVEVTGLIGRFSPLPSPIQIRVTEQTPGPGCNLDGEQDEDEGFEEFEQETENDNTVDELNKLNETLSSDTVNQVAPAPQVINGMSFITAAILICAFGVFVLGLCAFGFLGSDAEFEILIAKQLREAIIRRREYANLQKMNNAGIKDYVDIHYEANVARRQRYVDNIVIDQ